VTAGEAVIHTGVAIIQPDSLALLRRAESVLSSPTNVEPQYRHRMIGRSISNRTSLCGWPEENRSGTEGKTGED